MDRGPGGQGDSLNKVVNDQRRRRESRNREVSL